MPPRPAPSRLAQLIFIGGLVVWIANAVLWLGPNIPLGHDESQYATETREVLDGKPKRYPYVSIGMTVIATPGILAGGDERALRLLPILAGVLFLLAARHLARRVAGPDTANWLVGVLAGAGAVVKLNAQLLTDMPSTACLLAALAILLGELTREAGARYRLLAVAPLCAAAFYIRYGSLITIAIIGVVVLAVGARAIRRRPAPVLATAGLFVLLMLPHVITAVVQTGSPLGILRSTTGLPPGGLAEYFTGVNPLSRYGSVLAPLMLVGLVPLRRDRVSLALLAIAVAQLVVLGLITEAQVRYVLLAIVLLATLGIETLLGLVELVPARVRVALAACAAAAVVGMWGLTLMASSHGCEKRRAVYAPMQLAAAAIRADAGTTPCVSHGRFGTELEWYSRCTNVLAIEPNVLPADSRAYSVTTTETATPGTTIFYAPGLVRVVRVVP